MKKTTLAAATFALVYIMTGFVQWNWDPSTWGLNQRYYFILVASLATFLTATYPTE